MFDKKKFKAAVVLRGFTMKEIAAKLEIDEATLYRKMNGTSDFFRNEIQVLCEVLKLENPTEIFFAQEIT